MTLWPGLICEYSELYRGNLGIDCYELYANVQGILEELQSVNREFEDIVNEQDLMTIVPSRITTSWSLSCLKSTTR
jgi:hypothetical protein